MQGWIIHNMTWVIKFSVKSSPFCLWLGLTLLSGTEPTEILLCPAKAKCSNYTRCQNGVCYADISCHKVTFVQILSLALGSSPANTSSFWVCFIHTERFVLYLQEEPTVKLSEQQRVELPSPGPSPSVSNVSVRVRVCLSACTRACERECICIHREIWDEKNNSYI